MSALLLIILLLASTGYVLYQRLSLLIWTGVTAAILVFFSVFSSAHITLTICWLLFLFIALPFNIPNLRKLLFTRRLFALYKKIMPKMSDTEREALDAGTVTWEANVFAGKPDWKKLLKVPAATLTSEEQAFIDGPVEQLCAMVNSWDINYRLADIPPEVVDFIKTNRFLGMIIPKAYGAQYR